MKYCFTNKIYNEKEIKKLMNIDNFSNIKYCLENTFCEIFIERYGHDNSIHKGKKNCLFISNLDNDSEGKNCIQLNKIGFFSSSKKRHKRNTKRIISIIKYELLSYKQSCFRTKLVLINFEKKSCKIINDKLLKMFEKIN